jgi:hypothetical protein
MPTISLPVYGRKGVVALTIIDGDDLPKVEGKRLHMDRDRYVWFHGKNEAGRQTTLKLHRLITGAPAGMEVDHKNGNGLDNRRANLRVCTHAQNMMNMPKVKARSGFRGVRRMKNRWHARIQVRGKETHLGAFPTAEDAWRVRRAAELIHKGEFAPVAP